jgi:hypothetical protein
MQPFVRQQKQRVTILETLLGKYDDGKSKSFYCLCAALLPIEELKKILFEIKKEKQNMTDLSQSAEYLKSGCRKAAGEFGIELVYRKGKA